MNSQSEPNGIRNQINHLGVGPTLLSQPHATTMVERVGRTKMSLSLKTTRRKEMLREASLLALSLVIFL